MKKTTINKIMKISIKIFIPFIIKNFEHLKYFMEKILVPKPRKFKVSVKPSLDEILLLSLGCFNSYGAQTLLDNHQRRPKMRFFFL